jgi:peptide/nickel transport system substrate-binding protein
VTSGRAVRSIASLVAAILGIGCAGQTFPSPGSPATSSPNRVTGGTLKVGMDLIGHESFQINEEGTFNHIWDPQTAWAPEPFELFRCCLLRTLLSYNGRSTGEGGAELRPDLADDYPTISADGLTWTFHLKNGLHYAPPFASTPIVSGDIIRALERTLRPDPFAPPGEPRAFGPYSVYFAEVLAGADTFTSGTVSSISGLEAPDEQTLVVHLLRPAGDLGARLTLAAAAPIPPGAADGHDAGYGRYLVASGPYMIEGSDQLNPSLPPDQQPVVAGYVPATSLTLVRNPSWSNDDLRQALVDRIEISQINDYDLELASVLDGRLDLAFSDDLDAGDIARLRADATIAAQVHVAPQQVGDWILMNLAVPPFDDVHVRRAVNLATNKGALVAILDPGRQVLTHALPDSLENGLLSNYDAYATVDHAGSIEQAKAEMAQSRYDTNGDGVCDAQACQRIDLPIRNDEEMGEHLRAAQAFASQLAPLGIAIDVREIDFGDLFQHVTDPASRAPLVFTWGWTSDYLNASSWLGPLASGAAIGGDAAANLSLIGATPAQLAGWGYGVTQVPSLDRQIASCVALTGEAQFECWAEADQYLMERVVPWVPLDNRQTSRLTSTRMIRFSFDQSTNMPALEQIELAAGS